RTAKPKRAMRAATRWDMMRKVNPLLRQDHGHVPTKLCRTIGKSLERNGLNGMEPGFDDWGLFTRYA
ncbi:MAG: hypothetical protein J0H37_05385, partial [Hyphomicrobium denitrificans]|nr:hypothetical protein [Hyphomicrobium denitrificans]